MTVDDVQRRCRRQLRALFAVMVVSVAGLGVGLQLTFDAAREEARRGAERDLVVRYQRCQQNASGAASSNATREIERRLAQRVGDFTDAIGDVAGNPDVRAAADRLAAEAFRAARLRSQQAIPDCDAIYPDGARLSRVYGDQAPTLNTPNNQGATTP